MREQAIGAAELSAPIMISGSCGFTPFSALREQAICSSVKSDLNTFCISSLAAGKGKAGASRYSGTTTRQKHFVARDAQKLAYAAREPPTKEPP